MAGVRSSLESQLLVTLADIVLENFVYNDLCTQRKTWSQLLYPIVQVSTDNHVS